MKVKRQPDFNNLLAVLKKGKPGRPTLFEFFMNWPLYQRLTNTPLPPDNASWVEAIRYLIRAFAAAGYDYTTVLPSGFNFPGPLAEQKATKSLDGGISIRSRTDFKDYPWPDPKKAELHLLNEVEPDLPDGMKLIVYGPGGVLENVIQLCGYQGLCYLMMDDPELVDQIFSEVGSRLVEYYRLAAPYRSVGACISNDDWGFKTQTMLRLEDMRKYVFPWHKKIVQAIHACRKPAILHSCGRAHEIMDDIIDDLGYDGKHSYEDTIQPVEEAYDAWADRIAILGGIDVDFLCRSAEKAIRERVIAMLEKTGGRSWGIGSGNSIPEYVPQEKYLAMIGAALDYAA